MIKGKIQCLIDRIKQGRYDNEAVHGEYDDLLEEFIKGGLTKEDFPEIIELIELEKYFSYA